MNKQRVALVAAVLVVAVAAIAVLRLSSSSQPVDTAAPTVSSAGKAGDHAGHAGGHAPSSEGGGTAVVQLTPGGDEGTRITVRDGAPVGGLNVLKVKEGEPVRFTVVSDAAQEIHVHGYDLKAEATAGKPAQVAFRASIGGVFEVELEATGVQLARLVVQPR